MAKLRDEISSLQDDLSKANDQVFIITSATSSIVNKGCTKLETKLGEKCICNVNIKGYNFFHTDSPTNAGGAALYIADNLKAVPRPDIKFDIALVESCWAEIDAGEGKKKIIMVHPASAVHNYNTRYATNQKLCRPFSRTNYGLARFSVVASQTWEATPTKIMCLPLNSFKKEYKLFLLDSQAS